ncbi:MAG: hypothetical protein J7K98_03370 [Candidatus Aenigmarchaeota archaeon]|nr:hypothetical protein [Candidatus Aenigmarchaeota archaeon]
MNEKELLKQGWLKSKLWFEVLATGKEAAEQSLKSHVEKLEKLEGVIVKEKNFEKVEEVKKLPLQFKKMGLKKAYSQVVETTVFTDSIEKLLLVVMVFGPSAIEVLEPKEMKISIGTVQTIMNSVADMMHRFASSGVGGIIISRGDK